MNIDGHFDGWCRKHIGDVMLRQNFEHINRCVSAIRNRWDNETEITIEQPRAKVVQLRKRVDKSA